MHYVAKRKREIRASIYYSITTTFREIRSIREEKIEEEKKCRRKTARN
jgi:hypothetical protein